MTEPIWDDLVPILGAALVVAGFALTQAQWKGTTNHRIKSLEKGEEAARKSRSQIHDKIDDLGDMMSLQNQAMTKQMGEQNQAQIRQISELVGELRGGGFVNGGKKRG